MNVLWWWMRKWEADMTKDIFSYYVYCMLISGVLFLNPQQIEGKTLLRALHGSRGSRCEGPLVPLGEHYVYSYKPRWAVSAGLERQKVKLKSEHCNCTTKVSTHKNRCVWSALTALIVISLSAQRKTEGIILFGLDGVTGLSGKLYKTTQLQWKV